MIDIAGQIVAALVAGAAVAGKDVGNQAIRDAYEALKSGISYVFGPSADAAVEKVQSDPTSLDAKKTLQDAIGAIPESDVTRLEQRIAELARAIEADAKAKSVVEGLDPGVSIILNKINELNVGNVTSDGASRVILDVSEVKKATFGDLNFKSRLGN